MPVTIHDRLGRFTGGLFRPTLQAYTNALMERARWLDQSRIKPIRGPVVIDGNTVSYEFSQMKHATAYAQRFGAVINP